MSLHVALGGWTIGTDPQCIVPFAKRDKDITIALAIEDGESYCLPGLFEEELLVPGLGSTIPAEGILAMNKVLDDFSHLFTAIPGCTALAQHCIDTGDSAPVRCKLRPVNAKK